MARVLAVLEQRDGVIKKVSHEVLTAARKLGGDLGGSVDALLIGPDGLSAEGLGNYGAERVFVVTSDELKLYQPQQYAAAVVDVFGRGDYAAVLLGGTALGKDLGPRVAARLDVPLAADVTDIEYRDGILVSRPVYSGKAFFRLKITAPRSVIAVRPNVFTPAESSARRGTVEMVSPPHVEARERTVSIKETETAALDVAEASVVVSGGRGLKEPANFTLLEDLAAAFGNAAVGASRAVVDAGWRPHGDQVGQTGKTVSPGLYVAVGISGAIQHLAGMRTAKVIVAINKDKDAPIFKVADYGIVGDLFEIVPRLTEEIRKVRAG